jgi:hypothetical protein
MDAEVFMNKCLYLVGKMLDRKREEKPAVNHIEARRKFDPNVLDIAAGRTPKELLSDDEAWSLGEPPSQDETLPVDVAAALGLEPESTYGDGYSASFDEWQCADRDAARTRLRKSDD